MTAGRRALHGVRRRRTGISTTRLARDLAEADPLETSPGNDRSAARWRDAATGRVRDMPPALHASGNSSNCDRVSYRND